MGNQVPEAPPQSRWVPFSWPSAWKDPQSLDWLTGSPINCLVFEAGLADSGRVAQEAQRRGLAIVDWTKPEASGIVAGEASKISWNGAEPVAAIADAVWPGVQMGSGQGGSAADSGPTGAPWINANGWSIELARARAPRKTIWLVSKPKGNRQNIVIENAYLLAVADAAAGGARWLASLDEQLTEDLAARKEAAIGRWQKLAAALRYFEERRSWADSRPRAVVAVISTFSGANEFMSTELLNLAARRNLLCSPLLASQAATADFKPLRAIVCVDEEAPPEALRRKLEAFVKAGGALVAPAWAKEFSAGGKPLSSPVPGYDVWRLGSGRVAVPTAPWEDPYSVAADAHSLISHREDPFLLFNGASLMATYLTRNGGGGDLLELVRYTAESQGQGVSVLVRRNYSSVKMTTLEKPDGVDIRQTKVRDGVELGLSAFGVFAALEARL
jgi:hypothetical protein